MVSIAIRYLVGAAIALLAAKGIIEQGAVEGIVAALSALVTAIVEYVKSRH